MAGGTVGRGKGCAGRRVRRIISLLPGRQVALGIRTVVRLDRQIVVIVDVAVTTGGDFTSRSQLMRVRKWKASCGMVEIRRQP